MPTSSVHTTIRDEDRELFESIGKSPAEDLRMAGDFVRSEMEAQSANGQSTSTPAGNPAQVARPESNIEILARIHADSEASAARHIEVGMKMAQGFADIIQKAVQNASPVVAADETSEWEQLPGPVRDAVTRALVEGKGAPPSAESESATTTFTDVSGKTVTFEG